MCQCQSWKYSRLFWFAYQSTKNSLRKGTEKSDPNGHKFLPNSDFNWSKMPSLFAFIDHSKQYTNFLVYHHFLNIEMKCLDVDISAYLRFEKKKKNTNKTRNSLVLLISKTSSINWKKTHTSYVLWVVVESNTSSFLNGNKWITTASEKQ